MHQEFLVKPAGTRARSCSRANSLLTLDSASARRGAIRAKLDSVSDSYERKALQVRLDEAEERDSNGLRPDVQSIPFLRFLNQRMVMVPSL